MSTIPTNLSLEDTKSYISNNLNIITDYLDTENIKYNINLGQNYFPTKEYKGITYSEGNYESLVITLGEGKGDNWWCVLYPPLCLIDDTNLTENEYKSYIYEILNNNS